MNRRRIPVTYDPATDGAITMWLDPSDSSKLLDTGGGSISNGETIGTFNTSGGTARAFTQWGTNARPTWDSSGINGLGAVRCNSQLLAATTVTGFASMSGLTVMCVVTQVNSVAGSCAIGFTEIDNGTGKYDISLVQVRGTAGTFQAGGRRTTSDAFASVIGNTVTTPAIVGVVFDYANAKISIYENGVQGLQQQTFQTAGTTPAGEPHVLAIGGFAQETGLAVAGLCDARVGECLAWNSAMTPDQMFPAHNYLRRKWKIG